MLNDGISDAVVVILVMIPALLILAGIAFWRERRDKSSQPRL